MFSYVATLTTLFTFAAAPALAQGTSAATATGRVIGRIIDAKSGQGLTDVGVQVAGTPIGTMSGVDGRFVLARVPAGTITITARRIGFQAKQVTSVVVPANGAVEQHIALDASTVQLEAVVTSASAERGSVSAALDQQRTATGVVNAITAEQIAKSPDSDAAQAVQRVSGVTVQDGKYVFVRGLGERYTTTSLNGARLPSPEPERKVVPLDLFPSGLLQSITTNKTFTPELQGDFSGASVDVKTREFPAKRQFSFSQTAGWNQAASRSGVPFAGGVGGEQFAAAGWQRFIPIDTRYLGDLVGISQGQKNKVINDFRDSWLAADRRVRPNYSASASVGGNDPILGHRFGYLLSGSYSYNQEVRSGEVRAIARPGESAAQREVEINRFDGQSGRTSAMVGGLANFGTLIGTRTRLAFNNTFTRSADNDARIESGTYEDLALPVTIHRLDYVERQVLSSQLTGEHDLGRHKIEWSVARSGVTRDQPDRSEFVYENASGGRQLWLNAVSEGAVRTFAELDEDALETKADYRFEFGPSHRQAMLKVGALARQTDRRADVRAFGISAGNFSDEQRALSPNQIFDGRFTGINDALLNVRSLAQGGSYSAGDDLAAGYVMVDAGLTSTVRLIGGARYEQSQVRVDAQSTLGDAFPARRAFHDVLPSLALNYRPSETVNVRLSASRTLARPEYRELAGIRTREVIGGVDTRGNPDLVRTRISNLDARWEWYPSAGEVLSVGVFAKRFENPIERVFRPSNTNSLVTFINAEGADNLGVELEARKGLGFLGASLEQLAAFTNLTVMKSEIRLGGGESAQTNANRPMTGQSPYVVNGGLTWTSRSGEGSATLLYNRVGQRISAAGEAPLADVYEQSRDVLDLSMRFPMFRDGVSGRVDFRNVLDAPYRWTQGSIVRESYSAGRVVTAGVSWRP